MAIDQRLALDVQRRSLLLALLALPLLCAGARARATAPPAIDADRLRRRIAQLESQSGGRLGFALLDTGSGQRFDWRGGERFPMCSTFKLLLVAATLRRVEHGEETLARQVPVPASGLLPWSPFCETRAGKAASVEELCQAAMTQSDNTAANLLLAPLGGPAGLTAFARTIGDSKTRLDRTETDLNSAIAGDPRDTTTPLAMVANLQRLLLGDALAPASRELLMAWLRANRTGDARLRAGLPGDWRVGDKTGSGANGTTNDIAILTPPGRAPLLVAAYLTGSKLDSGQRDALHANLGQALSRS